MGRPAKYTKRAKAESDTTLVDPPVSATAATEESPSPLMGSRQAKKMKRVKADSDLSLVGPPVSAAEAKERWPLRYQSKVKKEFAANCSANGGSTEEKEILQARCHYTQAMIDGILFNLGDDAYVKSEDESPDYIARIVELFETTDKESYFTAQWFYRAEDTVIKNHGHLVDSRRVFLSDVKDDNPLNCIVSKVKIAQVDLNMEQSAKAQIISSCDLYCDMKYKLQHLTFASMIEENARRDVDASSIISSETGSNSTVDDISSEIENSLKSCNLDKSKKLLLDLYAGCGAMSTGLCMGASLSGISLVTRWAVDINPHACKSLKLNHPETEVRNEAAEDFLSLLKEWENLCKKFALIGSNKQIEPDVDMVSEDEDDNDDENVEKDDKEEEDNDDDEDYEVSSEVFEVERLLAVCFGDPNEVKKHGLYFKVRWKGYGPSEDSWEPIEGLSNCKEKLKEFVTRGYRSNILPLPGIVDFICGGPPCQGISGFNRFRNQKAPLDDVKNRQLVVYMDIIEYLRPKYVLMENVVDILKFAGGFLGRYAIGRLVSMNYQARLGMMAAGSYGVAQFRMRVFLWGAQPSEKLPQYPLPTHEVLSKGVIPTEFEEIVVAHDKNEPHQLERAIDLHDAISDLPPVTNDESEEERKYKSVARTEFQKYIRLKKSDLITYIAAQNTSYSPMLYDHQPLHMNEDDYERVCQIPKKKGANFRDLPGVLVREDNRVEWDQSKERVLLQSGKPLVPNYAMKFVQGRSTKPFGRLWWDEIVNTVVTRAEPHNQTILHPEQDRVLTIRENARLQGFFDCYKLCGPIKERYIQVGNAVAIPVAIALGYTYGMARQGLSNEEPCTKLPFKFPNCLSLLKMT